MSYHSTNFTFLSELEWHGCVTVRLMHSIVVDLLIHDLPLKAIYNENSCQKKKKKWPKELTIIIDVRFVFKFYHHRTAAALRFGTILAYLHFNIHNRAWKLCVTRLSSPINQLFYSLSMSVNVSCLKRKIIGYILAVKILFCYAMSAITTHGVSGAFYLPGFSSDR